MNKKSLAVIALLASLSMVAGACGGDNTVVNEDAREAEEEGTNTYDENDVTFDYPEEWDEFSADASAMSTGSNELWDTTVGPDETNLVNITAYKLNIEVTEDNIADIEGELNGVIQQVVSQAGGEVAGGPTQTTLAGFPAYEYEWAGVEVDGEEKDSRAVFLFDGDTEYFLNCQYSADAEEEILNGCELILESFESSGA